MRYLILCIIAALMLFIAGCAQQLSPQPGPGPVPPAKTVDDFESCVAAGNPVMESYPRQCRHQSRTYTEVIDAPPDTPPQPLPDGPIVGGDVDEHGCRPSTGYRWCEATQQCQRFWEDPCDTELEQNAGEYCDVEDVSEVHICGDFIKVIRASGDEEYYYSDMQELECGPFEMETEDCQAATGADCELVCGDEDPRHLAEILAVNYVQDQPAYRDFDGRNIVATNVAVLRCPGCYDVEVRFERDSAAGSGTIHALAHVDIRDFKAADVTFQFDETDFAPGCEDQCGDGECAEMVCAAIGCPCAEDDETCPEDCA